MEEMMAFKFDWDQFWADVFKEEITITITIPKFDYDCIMAGDLCPQDTFEDNLDRMMADAGWRIRPCDELKEKQEALNKIERKRLKQLDPIGE